MCHRFYNFWEAIATGTGTPKEKLVSLKLFVKASINSSCISQCQRLGNLQRTPKDAKVLFPPLDPVLHAIDHYSRGR
jgi:hypothetical protein